MFALTVILFYLALTVTCVVGYVLNVLAIIHHVGFGLLEVVRIVGLFIPPLGAFMGLFV